MEVGVTSADDCDTACRMWAFLIPVILLAGATFTGAALDMSSKSAPPAAPGSPTNQAATGRTLPVNGPLPFDSPSRQR
jgi:hypothetical protein